MRRRANCQRGTASVEIVVMLPVFIALLAATYYVHDVARAGQRALGDARACAYHFVMRGCTPEAAASPICSGVQAATTDALDGYDDDTRAHRSVIDRLEDWPVFGAITEGLFGKAALASAQREHRGFTAARTGAQKHALYMVCNPPAPSFRDRVRELLKSLVGR